MNAWQGPNWYEIGPNIRVLSLTNVTDFKENSSLLIKATPILGAYIADIRVVRIDINNSKA